VMEPDEEAQGVVRLVLAKLAALGSARAVLRYLVQQGIRRGLRPHHGPQRGQLVWRRPCYGTVLSILHHPLYAGAYTHGRHPIDPRRQVPGRRSTGRTSPPRADWAVLKKDHVPASITWEPYEANQERLRQNQARVAARGVPRPGAALLGGLLFCGRCGRRLRIGYNGSTNSPRYRCNYDCLHYGAAPCQSLAAADLDACVGQQVRRLVEPTALELRLAAAAEVEQERARLHQQWQQRLERAAYEADRAARQYQAVEPANRLVVRALERQWEQALLEQRQLHEAYDRFGRDQPRRLGVGEREQIGALAGDVPALWQASATTAADRQEIIRHLVERVVVTVLRQSEQVDVTIHWAGGAVSQHQVRRSIRQFEPLRDYERLRTRMVELRAAGWQAQAIAEQLQAEGFHTTRRDAPFTAAIVRQLLSRCGLSSRRSRARVAPARVVLGAQEWWLADLAQEVGASCSQLRKWRRRGWLQARQLPGIRGRWIYWADAEERERLRQLAAYKPAKLGQPYPAPLTTPKPRSES
jgi:hypothetical protein